MIRLLFILISLPLLLNSSDIQKNEYLVKPGDNLWAISKALNVSLGELIELNQFQTYRGEFPIIKPNQRIKFSRTSEDDIKDYCYSDMTFKGVNLSKILSKKDIINSCISSLRKDLDPYVIGNLDSWHKTEKSAERANSSPGIDLSWSGSENINIDEHFWRIYFSDKRYSYYFYNLFIAESERENADKVLTQAALKGDSIAADYVLSFLTFNYKKNLYGYKTEDDLKRAVIDELEPNLRKYFKQSGHSYLYTNDGKPKSNDNFFASIIGEKLEDTDLSSKFDDQQLSHRYKGQFLFNEIKRFKNSGDLYFYKLRKDSLEYIQNSNSKLMTWVEMGLVVRIMYLSINTGDPEIAVEISSLVENRMGLNPLKNFRGVSIYNRFIQNLDLQNLSFPEEAKNMPIILDWVLNLTSALNDTDKADMESFRKEREYLLEVVNNAHKNDYIRDRDLAEWQSDTASKLLNYSQSCIDAEAYFKPAFKHYKKSTKIVTSSDYFLEPLLLARCYINERNIPKAELYLKQASKYLSLFPYKQVFYQSFIDLNKAKLSILKKEHQEGFIFLRKSSEIISNEKILSHTLSHTLNKDVVAKYINDYINTYKNLKLLDFDMNNLMDYFELEGLKNRISADGRLEKMNLNAMENLDTSLTDALSKNRAEIDIINDKLDQSPNIKYREILKGLNAAREKLHIRVEVNEPRVKALINPSHQNYVEMAKDIDEESVVLSYNLASDGGMIIAQTDSGVSIFKIEESSQIIQSNINKLRSSIKNIDSNFSYDASYYLYQTLIEPLNEIIKNKSNIYLYGSELEDLQFGVLIENFDEINDILSERKKLLTASWLIKKYSFARIFPLSNNVLNKKEYDQDYLGFADPNSFMELGLPELPGAVQEIKAIGRSSSSNPSLDFILTGPDASKSNLITRLSESYERIVFATHSVPPNWNGIKSEGALVLSDENGDYLLTATEIVNLDVRSDIVVLSSCSTEEKGSDTLYKSFLVAGANSVMYTNWEQETISAARTTDLVFEFIAYDKYSKQKALQEAAKKIMEDQEFAHPAFWGNFSIAYRNLESPVTKTL